MTLPDNNPAQQTGFAGIPPALPDLAVVIVAYNSAHVVTGLLDSIPAALDGLEADVVLIDNDSADGTADLVAVRKDCRVVRSANVGYAAGINRGVAEAVRADAILALNADVRLGERSVRPLLDALKVPGTGIVVPQLRWPDGVLQRSLRREPTLLRSLGLAGTRVPALTELVSAAAEYSRAHLVDWASGAVVMMSRACFDSLGGWDESYFLYSEETDFSLRARDLGLLTRYEPRSVAIHEGGGSGQSEITYAMQVVNRVRLYRRRHGTAASWLYYLLIISGQLKWAACGRRASRFAVAALLRPSVRPMQLGCSRQILPQ
jgi:N-acetylglucosaminyl-diphospho-decaprenol L-rhamnosyltransferase